MANLVSIGTGNWLTAGTWALVDATSYANSETTGATPPTLSGVTARSAGFTTGIITISGIAVKLRNRTGTTGTITIRLYNNSLGSAVAATSVTLNMADLNAATTAALDGGWIVTSFANVILLAATSYMVEVFTSSATQISLFSGSGNDWSRMLVTSTTQAPVAGDDVVVAGEYTGAGTSNSFTVTMDCAAATDHGSNTTSAVTPALAVAAKGILKYKDTSAANPLLRLSGYAIVYNGGTLYQGKAGTVTITIASPGVVTWTAHGLIADQIVRFNTTGALPTGLTQYVEYFVVGASITADTFQVSATAGGAAINTTGSQSGTHTGAAPIPRDSVAVLEFDCAADGDFGLLCRNGSIANLQGLSRTSGKNVVSCKLNTDEAIASVSLGVDTDTGWLDNDQIAVASTTRTAGNSELGAMNGAANASDLPVDGFAGAGGGLAVAHSGTSPTQAEVINITRNVKVRSVSATAMTWIFADTTAAVDIDWIEVYYVGVNTAGKRGIEVQTTTGSFSMQFSSIHDTEINGFYILNAAANNITFSSNVMWNLSTTTGPGCQISALTSGTAITIDSNILIKTTSSNGWTLSDLGGTFTNNTVVSAAAAGIQPLDAAVIGTFSGNIAHSNAGRGIHVNIAGVSGIIASCASWRNTGVGLDIAATCVDLIVTDAVLFGNTTDNVAFNASSGSVTFNTPIMNGDTTFATTNGIRFVVAGMYSVIINNGDFSTVAGIKTAHTNDINISAANNDLRSVLRNTKLGAATEVATPGNLAATGYISSQKHDQTAGLHKTWTKYGATTGGLIIDSVIFNTAAPSLRCIPVSATSKLESAPQFQGVKVAVASNATCTISVDVRKSVVGDSGGVAYAGNQPRLIQKANPALGQNSDVVIDTMTVANGNWEQLTGTSSTATADDGVWEFIVDCDGTSGAWVNVDDWAAS